MAFRKCKCVYCEQMINVEEDRVKYDDNGRLKVKKNLHKSCLESYKNKEQVRKDFSECYEFTKKLMGYNDRQQLTGTQRCKLEAFYYGTFVQRGVEYKADMAYPHEVIMTTLKLCKPIIERALIGKSFENENHKYNYIIAIIRSNINDVYMRLKKKEEHNKTIENKIYNIQTEDKTKEYKSKPKTNNKVSGLLEDMGIDL